ncbi:Nucleotidylyl transferase [Xylariaceae sp. FL1272]|nr:Nucleotidylyl transferase [Xylariaceae sp. FL1272]
MPPRLPPNLIALFSQALNDFQLSDSTLRVLCSIVSSAVPDTIYAKPPRLPPKTILVLDSSFNPPTQAHHRMALSALSDPRYRPEQVADNHSIEARGLSETAPTSRVLLLLAINNADKAPKPAAFPERLAMMYVFAQQLLEKSSQGSTSVTRGRETVDGVTGCEAVDIAVTTEPYFHAKCQAVAISDFYSGTEYTDSLASAVSIDNAIDSEQVYLTGFDTLIRIFNPKYYPDNSMKRSLDPLFAHSRLRVTMRTDDEWGAAAEQIAYLDDLRAGKLEELGGRPEWVEKVEMVQGRRDDEEIVSSTKVRDAIRKQDWDALKLLVSTDIAAFIREHGLYAEQDG